MKKKGKQRRSNISRREGKLTSEKRKTEKRTQRERDNKREPKRDRGTRTKDER